MENTFKDDKYPEIHKGNTTNAPKYITKYYRDENPSAEYKSSQMMCENMYNFVSSVEALLSCDAPNLAGPQGTNFLRFSLNPFHRVPILAPNHHYKINGLPN